MKAFEVSKTSVPITTDYKYSTADTYEITVPIAGDYEFELIGGGGPATINNTYYQQGLVGLCTGGSGAYFHGTLGLPAGTYTLVVGALGSSTTFRDSSGTVLVSAGGGGTPSGGSCILNLTPVGTYTALPGNSGVRHDSVTTNYGAQSGGTGWTVDGHVYGQGQGTALTAGPDLSHYMLKKSGGSGGYARVTLTTSFIDKYVLNAFNHEYIPAVFKDYYQWTVSGDFPVFTDSITNPQKLYWPIGQEIQPAGTYPLAPPTDAQKWDIVNDTVYCWVESQWFVMAREESFDFSEEITSTTYGKMKLIQ